MKYALIIANTEYSDSGLRQLSAPGKDAAELARVLRSRDLAAFDNVKILINENATTLRESIDDLFSRKESNDLLLLYFSGHGVKDEFGTLYLAVKNTRVDRLRSTAIDSGFIRLGMDQSGSTKQVIILDCCNSGAFSEGIKGVIGDSVGTREAFEGKGMGRVVLTASDKTQYAFEDSKIKGDTINSIFTKYLIKGIEGEADTDDDGVITIDDLYIYTYNQVTRNTSKQTPRKFTYAQEGEIIIRELTADQKRAREERQLQEQRKREEDEKKRLAEEETRRIKVEMEIEAERAARKAAEEKALAIQEQIANERKGRETIDLENGRQIHQHTNGESISLRKHVTGRTLFLPMVIGLLVIVGGLLGIYIVTRQFAPTSSPNLKEETTTAIMTGSLGTDPAPVSASDQTESTSQPSLFQLPPNSPIPIDTLKGISPDNAAAISAITYWGNPVINDLKYSPNGKVIAAATSIGIYIYDADSLHLNKIIETGGLVNCVLFSPDGKVLFSCSEEDGPQAWNLESGNQIDNFFDLTTYSSVASIEYSPETSLILVGYKYGSVDIFNTDGTAIVNYENLTNNVADLVVSPDGKTLAVVSNDALSLFDINENGEVTHRSTNSGQGSYGVKGVFSPDGKSLLVMDQYGASVTLWRTSDGLLLQTLYNVRDAIFSQDENVIVASTYENGIQLIDLSTTAVIKTIAQSAKYFSNLSVSPDGKGILGKSLNRIQIWDLATGNMEVSSSDYADTINYYAFSTDGKLIASSNKDSGSIIIRNAITGSVIREIDVSDFYVWDLSFTPDGSTLVFNAGQVIYFVGVMDGSVIKKIGDENEYGNRPQNNALSPDGQKLAYFTDNENFSITIISTQNQQILQSLTDDKTNNAQYRPWKLAFSSDGETLATSTDGSVDLWSMKTGRIVKQIRTPDQYAPQFDFLSNGTIALSSDAKINIATSNGENTPKTFIIPASYVNRMVLSPDESMLMAATSDGYIHLWNFSDGSLITSFKVSKERNSLLNPSFSPDEKLIIVSSNNGTLQIWGVTK